MADTRSHKTRYVNVGNRVAGVLCGCGRPVRPKTVFCGDECRFWAKVQKGPGCWLWTGSRSGGRKGKTYGQFTKDLNGKRVGIGAHVYAYELTHGPVPDGLQVLHSCDVPLCVRNDAHGHLSVGTKGQNMADAVARKRFKVAKPAAQKLSAEDIYKIRSLVNSGELRYRVADSYGISKAYVTRIMAGTARHHDAPMVSERKKVG